MLSNAYFLAKFGFDTAENELAKNLQKFCVAQAGGAPPRGALLNNVVDLEATRHGRGGEGRPQERGTATAAAAAR